MRTLNSITVTKQTKTTTMKIKIYDAKEKTKYVYPKEVMEQAINEFMKKEHRYVTSNVNPNGITVRLTDVIGTVDNIEFIGDEAYADITFLNTQSVATMTAFLMENAKFVPRGIGKAVSGKVTDYEIICIDPILP